MDRPGRLGDPELSLATDPRTHKGLLKGLEAHGMQHNAFLTADISPDAPLADIVAFARASEQSLEKMVGEMDFDIDHPTLHKSITRSDSFVTGSDGNDIALMIYRPIDARHSLPAVVYFHGGGMVMLRTSNRLHTTYAESIAKLGFTTILVDFRNVLPSHPHEESINHFPAGLNDCISAVKWIHHHKADLQINKIVLHGDSGGANLAMATALKLNQAAETKSIVAGVFALDPYISGSYAQPLDWKLAHLPSLVECDGYDVSCSASALYARLYDQDQHQTNPLAWPYWATVAEITGLPPHRILSAELDPLRDEGVVYCGRLARAGVQARGWVRAGMTHTGEVLLRSWVEERFVELLIELREFVEVL